MTASERGTARAYWAMRAWMARGLSMEAAVAEVETLTANTDGDVGERLPNREVWRDLAWCAIGWDPERWRSGAWCSAWAALCDNEATGGPGFSYNFRKAASVTRRMGRGPAGGGGFTQAIPCGRAGAVGVGDIISVNPKRPGGPGGHVVIVVAHDGEGGVLTVSGNGTGILATGRVAHGDVVARTYGAEDLCHVVTPMDDAYTDFPASVSPKAFADAQAQFLAKWPRHRDLFVSLP